MPKFSVFQQHPPVEYVEDGVACFSIRIEPVGEVEARDGTHAIALARTWPVFRKAKWKTLARAPIVEQQGIRPAPMEQEDRELHEGNV